MSLGSKFSPLMVGVIALGGFLGYLYIKPDAVQETRAGAATPVKVTSVVSQTFPVTIEALGTAKANESVTITAQRADIIASVNFEDGERVKAGQLLVQLNDREERARVQELEANIAEAERQYKRIKNLAKSSAASEQLLDEQQAKVKALQAQLDVAQAQLTDLQIRAPFTGVLGIREVSKGALVRPADVITTLDDVSLIKVDFSVAENQLASLADGQRVMATSVAYPGEQFEGEITSIDSRIDPVTRAIMVRAQINNESNKLRPGMLLTITLEKEVLQTLVIPEKALVPIQDTQYVYVANGNKVEQRVVIIGERKPGLVQVIKGLKEGERVVSEGTLRVQDGSPVRILNDSNEG